MKFRASLLVFASLTAIAAACWIVALCDADRALTARAAEPEGDGPPPLVIDRSAPLLLDEPETPDPFDAPKGPVADNQACYVCHTNYEEEPLVKWHAEANVGCIKCHGASEAPATVPGAGPACSQRITPA